MIPKTYDDQWNHAGSIVRQRGKAYQVETNHNGRRVRKTFPTLGEAKTYAEQKRVEVKNRGNLAFALSETQLQDALEALDILHGKGDGKSLAKPRGTPLAESARFWVQHNKPHGGTLSLSALLSEYIAAKRKLNRREATIWEIENKLGNVVSHFKDRLAHTVTNAELEAWLDANTGTPNTRNKYKRLLFGLFRFAKKKHLVEVNPAADIETAAEDERPTEIYTVDEVDRMLGKAVGLSEGGHIPLDTVPALCVGLFAGLRPTELAALDWRSIHFDQRHILVTAGSAKKRRRRYVKISDNLVAWLLAYRKESGPVCPADITFRRARAKIVREARLSKWISDGLRHSFGSYHVAMHGDAGKTAFEMGHLNAELLYEHYRELVSENDAKRYWNIHPRQDQQFIAFPESA